VTEMDSDARTDGMMELIGDELYPTDVLREKLNLILALIGLWVICEIAKDEPPSGAED